MQGLTACGEVDGGRRRREEFEVQVSNLECEIRRPEERTRTCHVARECTSASGEEGEGARPRCPPCSTRTPPPSTLERWPCMTHRPASMQYISVTGLVSGIKQEAGAKCKLPTVTLGVFAGED